jgi:peptidoglycan/LPS O-acetylase OafA/YrhL
MSTLPVHLAAATKVGNRIPTLDGWRGVAILLVLADHLQFGLLHRHELLPTGGHGVAIFFVLSGYLITSKLRDEFQHTGSLDLKSFYVRRFFRLMPAAWTYLLLIGFVSHHAASALRFDAVAACILFYRNFIDPGPGSFLTGHFWSLSIEEQFYLFWPSVLILLGFRRARYFAVTAAVAVAIWRVDHWSSLATLTSAATFGTQYRADALFVGCAAALSLPLLAKFSRAWMMSPLLLVLGLYMLRFGLLISLGESVIIAILLYSTSAFSHTRVGRALEWKPLAYLGTISYSLYLWQQPFLCTPIHGWLAAVERLIALTIIATLSHHGLEKPAIRLGYRLSGSREKSVRATSAA